MEKEEGDVKSSLLLKGSVKKETQNSPNGDISEGGSEKEGIMTVITGKVWE